MNQEYWQQAEIERTKLIEKYPKLLGGHGYPGVGTGWLPIIDKLCSKLVGDVRVDQIKEKFGGLRFYFASDNYELNSKLVREAENEASVTCDVCGKPGTLRTGGWMVTRCDEHA